MHQEEWILGQDARGMASVVDWKGECGRGNEEWHKFTQVGLTGMGGRATLIADTGLGRLRHPASQTGHTRPLLRRLRG